MSVTTITMINNRYNKFTIQFSKSLTNEILVPNCLKA